MLSVPPEVTSKQPMVSSFSNKSKKAIQLSRWYTALLEVRGNEQSEMREVVGPAVYTGCIIHIPGGKEMDLMCKVRTGPQRKTYAALIESHLSMQLPQNIFVAKVLADVKRGCAPVRVMNDRQREVTIKPHTRLANVFLVDRVMEFADREQEKCDSRGGNEACLSLDQVVNAILFSKHHIDYGNTKTVQYEIPLVDFRPFRLPYRKISPTQWQDARRMFKEMETAGVIQLSKSPYASQVVIVTKKGPLRLCMDYRKLNSCSMRNAFSLPKIEEALEALGQAKYFSTLDLIPGY